MAYRILSLDGGGIRGVVTAVLLDRLDQAVPGWRGKIDLIAGTSTGGIITLGLANGLQPPALRDLYVQQGKDIFDESWTRDLADLGGVIGSTYDNEKLTQALQKVFGTRTLNDLVHKVLIPAFWLDNREDARSRSWTPKIFHNFPGEDSDGDTLAYKAALYTSAAPTYFPSVDGYVDGGVFANNPAMCALAQTQDRRAIAAPPPLSDIRLLSIGTGTSLTFISDLSLDWGKAQWIKPLLNILMDGVSGISDYECKRLLNDGYHRQAPVFPAGTIIPMDAVDRIPELLIFASGIDLTNTIAWLKAQWE